MTNQIPDTTIKTGLVLAPQVKAMLDKEAYHYCADCHTHCRQTILAVEATKEAAKAYDALREALETIAHPNIGHEDPLALKKIARAALSLVDHPATKEGNR